MPNPKLLILLAMAWSTPLLGRSAADYDFFVCTTTSRTYVVGATVTSVHGVFQQTPSGGWQHLGYSETTITAVAFDPRDRNVVYTSAFNGLWRSLDGGRTWRMCNSWDMTEGRDVAVDPNAPDHVYLALPDGVAVSTDRAQTLARRENGLPARGKYTQAIEIDRTRAGRVFAACEIGLYLTENGGEQWRQVFAAKETVTDIQQSFHDPQLWLAVTQSAGALISRDGGLTWKSLPGVPTDAALYNVTFDVTQPARFAIGSWAHGVLISEDGGQTWTRRNEGLPNEHRVRRVGIDPAGRLYASVTDERLFVSDDFGRTWRPDVLPESRINNFVLVPKAAP